MRNISKKLIVLFALLIATIFIASAQNTAPASKPAASKEVAKQAPAEKFFNVTSLDDLKDKIDAAQANYKSATQANHDALHVEYLKAKRLYTVELEKNLSAYSKESVMGKKIREELNRVNVAD